MRVRSARPENVIHAVPMLSTAYHTAMFVEKDVDQPRDLANSVTVG